MKKDRRNSSTPRLLQLGDAVEGKSYLLGAKLVHRLVSAFFLFKKRKGEMVAGSATFFIILSFCPILLLFISMMGNLEGDVDMARAQVLDGIKSVFPQLAPWILSNIRNIIDDQLAVNSGMGITNLFFLGYSCLGVVASIIFGMNIITQREVKGGFVFEDIKSMTMGLLMSVYMIALLVFSQKSFLINMGEGKLGLPADMVEMVVKYNVLPVISSLTFFTLFFKVSKKMVKFKNALLGGVTFVGCFLAGKSFYWLYLTYAREGLHQNYGDFYSIFVAAFWIYFLMCSFFFSACVAYVDLRSLYSQAGRAAKATKVAKKVLKKDRRAA